jgi:hypothetical protein
LLKRRSCGDDRPHRRAPSRSRQTETGR